MSFYRYLGTPFQAQNLCRAIRRRDRAIITHFISPCLAADLNQDICNRYKQVKQPPSTESPGAQRGRTARSAAAPRLLTGGERSINTSTEDLNDFCNF